jgi:hypothetical protein
MELGDGCYKGFKLHPRKCSNWSFEVQEPFPHIHNIMPHDIIVYTHAGDTLAEGHVEHTSKDMIRVCVSASQSSIQGKFVTKFVHSPFTYGEVNGSTWEKKGMSGTYHRPDPSLSESCKLGPSSCCCTVIVTGGILLISSDLVQQKYTQPTRVEPWLGIALILNSLLCTKYVCPSVKHVSQWSCILSLQKSWKLPSKDVCSMKTYLCETGEAVRQRWNQGVNVLTRLQGQHQNAQN